MVFGFCWCNFFALSSLKNVYTVVVILSSVSRHVLMSELLINNAQSFIDTSNLHVICTAQNEYHISLFRILDVKMSHEVWANLRSSIA